ncbi:hypothetical protein [Akkermansia sp.]|nr:hypothetical protein [Akkermansia sp.]
MSEPMVFTPDALEQLRRIVMTIMAIPPHTGRFLDWKDICPGVDE